MTSQDHTQTKPLTGLQPQRVVFVNTDGVVLQVHSIPIGTDAEYYAKMFIASDVDAVDYYILDS